MMLPPSPVSPPASRVQNSSDARGTIAQLINVTASPVITETTKARRLPAASR